MNERTKLNIAVAFITLFMPITITGLMAISGESVSISLLSFSGVCASLNGTKLAFFRSERVLLSSLQVLPMFLSSITLCGFLNQLSRHLLQQMWEQKASLLQRTANRPVQIQHQGQYCMEKLSPHQSRVLGALP